MNKKMLIIFAAELAAHTAVRAIQILKRDRMILPRGAKVKNIAGIPVLSRMFTRKKPKTKEWTPTFIDGKIQNPPGSPDR